MERGDGLNERFDDGGTMEYPPSSPPPTIDLFGPIISLLLSAAIAERMEYALLNWIFEVLILGLLLAPITRMTFGAS